MVQCFVDGSIKGWYNYPLRRSNEAAIALIQGSQPRDVTDDKIDFAIGKLKSWGIVDSGDALETMGIGVITDEKVVEGFYDLMVEAGVVVDAGIDYKPRPTPPNLSAKVSAWT